MIGVGMITQLPCRQKRLTSAAGGALVLYTGMQRAVPFLPPVVHYALAGVAVDSACRGLDVMNPSMETAISAAAGVAGAVVLGYVTGRGAY